MQAQHLEINNVKHVYDKIASHFSTTRYKAWPTVDRFLKSLSAGMLGVDIGCGNGKNMLVRPDLFTMGLDLSFDFVKICQQQGLECLQGTMLSLPYRRDSQDFAICIAALHHLSTAERRKQALLELERILNSGGSMLIYVWAFEQPADSNLYKQGTKLKYLNGDKQDVLVPWNLSSDPTSPQIEYRYYHLFKQFELDALLKDACCMLEIVESGYDRDNWFVIAKKI